MIVRQELLYEQTFDHVVLSLPDVPGFCEPLYVDADGIASADELLKRWRTREHLHCPTLDDPAECARFVGHLNQEFVSCWLAQELEIRFGQPEGNDLLRALGGTPRRRIA